MQVRTYFIQDPNTRFALPGAQVYVYANRTSNLATVYSATGATLGQPLTADSFGKVAFAAPDGLYSIMATGNGATMQLDDVEFFDYGANKAQVLALVGQVQGILGTTGVTQIGAPGQPGFGVGVCAVPPPGFAPLAGTLALGADDYGNYRYTDGSIMCWVPAFYYRIASTNNPTYATYGVNSVDVKDFSAYPSISAANSAGYALHRAFYDGGVVKPGFFIDKYTCSNNGGIASSVKFGNPLSTSPAHNPIGALVNAPGNFYGACFDAAKSRGADFFCAMLCQHKALALLSLAHAQAATTATSCAWYDPAGTINFPKGNNNNALRDGNDTSVIFVSDGYTDSGAHSALCGSGTPFAKTTHNGQACGVADLNGNMWSVAPGLCADGTNYYTLNTSVAAKSVTSGTSSATDAWGSVGLAAMYTNVGTTFGALAASGANLGYGNAGQTLSGATSGTGWTATGLGVPQLAGGTNLFGVDYLWDKPTNQLCPLVGGDWAGGTSAGVWAVYLNSSRGDSNGTVGFRAALYP